MYRTDKWIVQLISVEIEDLEIAAELMLTSKQDIASTTAENFPLPTLGPKLLAVHNELIRGRDFFLL